MSAQSGLHSTTKDNARTRRKPSIEGVLEQRQTHRSETAAETQGNLDDSNPTPTGRPLQGSSPVQPGHRQLAAGMRRRQSACARRLWFVCVDIAVCTYVDSNVIVELSSQCVDQGDWLRVLLATSNRCLTRDSSSAPSGRQILTLDEEVSNQWFVITFNNSTSSGK